MADKKTYIVDRAMQSGAESFARGDEREMMEAEAAPLVASGALYLKGGEPAERAPVVQHTFGTADSKDGVVSLSKDVSDSRVEGRRSAAKRT